MTNIEALYDQLEFDFDSFKDKSYLTHNYHPYPAKYVPQIPKQLLISLSKPHDLVLDPFCGSGTTLVECLINSRSAIGNDLNPIASLVSKVKTTILSEAEVKKCMKIANEIGPDVSLLYGHSTLFEDKLEFESKYKVPNFFHIDHWFEPHVQKELAIIIDNIRRMSDGDSQAFLLVAFSSIITSVSNMESDTRYARTTKNIKPKDTYFRFLNKVDDMCKRMGDLRKTLVDSDITIKVYNKDSKKLDFVKTDSVDLVITSPPYPNTYDYYLYHRNRMYWLGINSQHIQTLEIGSRNKHSDDDLGIEHYLEPIKECLSEMRRVLKRDKYLAVVIGDAIIMGKYINMDLEYEKLVGKLNFTLVKKVTYPQRNYTSAFTRGYKKVDKKGHIMVFKSH